MNGGWLSFVLVYFFYDNFLNVLHKYVKFWWNCQFYEYLGDMPNIFNYFLYFCLGDFTIIYFAIILTITLFYLLFNDYYFLNIFLFIFTQFEIEIKICIIFSLFQFILHSLYLNDVGLQTNCQRLPLLDAIVDWNLYRRNF